MIRSTIYSKVNIDTLKEVRSRKVYLEVKVLQTLNETVSRNLVERDRLKHCGRYSYDQFRIGSNPIQ